MTYLITKHDYKHLHAISGLLAILNFIYNIYNLIFFNSNKLNIYLVANNLFLALLSLQFKLPEKRNLDKPMIWKEFRLHSILFTFRHTSITILSLLKLDYYIVKHFIIIITLYLADLITQKYGNNEIRTTNYMPYSNDLDQDSIIKIKRSYTKKQFGATIFCILNSIDCNYLPLYGIQSAPFMMTLVRKDKVSTKMYHIIYSLSLQLPFYLYFIFIRKLQFGINDLIFAIYYKIIYDLRIKFKLNKYILWNITLPIFYYIYYYNTLSNYNSNYLSYFIIIRQIIIDYNIYKKLYITKIIYN